MRFKLLKGIHADPGPDAKTYKKGAIIETDDPLDKMFQNKFERLDDKKGSKSKKETKKKRPVMEEEPEDEEETDTQEEASEQEELPEPESEFGEDVTDKFKGGKEGGLKVFHSTEGYIVTDANDAETPLNDAPFRSKKETQRFVDENGQV